MGSGKGGVVLLTGVLAQGLGALVAHVTAAEDVMNGRDVRSRDNVAHDHPCRHSHSDLQSEGGVEKGKHLQLGSLQKARSSEASALNAMKLPLPHS